jgi:hypothetical protein
MMETYIFKSQELKVTMEIEEKPDRISVRMTFSGRGYPADRKLMEKWSTDILDRWNSSPKPIEMKLPQTGHHGLVFGDANSSLGVWNIPGN